MVHSMRSVVLKLPSPSRRARPGFPARLQGFDAGAPAALGLASPFKIVVR